MWNGESRSMTAGSKSLCLALLIMKVSEFVEVDLADFRNSLLRNYASIAGRRLRILGNSVRVRCRDSASSDV
jgi:hypothetical protein